ncbi:hypothetical protein, partial [Prevotella denticola]|uniref:hypothetical protein n=1 Tax=Prevotella denticola TaxID=28129 RepID=UPI003C78BD4E
EMLLTILASLSQEESRSISENVNWGIRKKMTMSGLQLGTFSAWIVSSWKSGSCRSAFCMVHTGGHGGCNVTRSPAGKRRKGLYQK